jgi:hypothetical protein
MSNNNVKHVLGGQNDNYDNALVCLFCFIGKSEGHTLLSYNLAPSSLLHENDVFERCEVLFPFS